MAYSHSPRIVTDGLVLSLDAANVKSFRGEPTVNTVPFPGAGAGRYNNPGFSGGITNTGQMFMGSPIWEVTFIPQDAGRVPRLGSTEGFGFWHSMGTQLFPNTEYMSSVYFRTEYPLVSTSTQGFSNTYSNIPGWGFQGTTTTRIQEGEWTRLYTKYFRNIVIQGNSYIDRGISNILQATVNTTQTTQVLVTVTIQSNGTFTTSTSSGSNNIGGGIVGYAQHVGIRSANPNITNNGGISGLSTGTSAIVNHGLNTSNWEKISDSNPMFRTSYPFQYYILMNIPSTGGNNVNISFRPNFSGFYSSVSDNKFWKVTFDTTNLQVNDVIRTYWAAPMLEEHNRPLPSRFVVGTRGTTVATGGGWADRSGNNNHGELVNGPTFDSDNLGSLVFDGVDDYVESVPIQPTFFTLSSWFKATGPGTNNNGGYLIGSSPQLFNGNVQYALLYNWIDQRIVGVIQTNTGTISTIDNSVLRNQIYNAVLTYDGSVRSIYINGTLSVSNSYSTNPIYPTTGNINTQIGRWGFGSFQRHFNGNIYNTSIYNRALTPEEILQNYNASKGRYGL